MFSLQLSHCHQCDELVIVVITRSWGGLGLNVTSGHRSCPNSNRFQSIPGDQFPELAIVMHVWLGGHAAYSYGFAEGDVLRAVEMFGRTLKSLCNLASH